MSEPVSFVVDEIVEIPEHAGEVIIENGVKRVIATRVVTTLWSCGRQDVRVEVPNLSSCTEVKPIS